MEPNEAAALALASSVRCASRQVDLGSQTVVWEVPGLVEIKTRAPADDLFSDSFRLADGSYWRLILRPCTYWAPGLQPEQDTVFVSANHEHNWIGIWLQQMADDSVSGSCRGSDIAYCLAVKSPHGQTCAALHDNWQPQFKHQQRGTYWFVSWQELSAHPYLLVEFTAKFSSQAGDSCALPPVVDLSSHKDALLIIFGGKFVEVHSGLLASSAFLKARLREPTALELSEWSAARTNSGVRYVCDIRDLNLPEDIEVARTFVDLLYHGCETRLKPLTVSQLVELRRLIQVADMPFQRKLVERVLKDANQYQSTADLLQAWAVMNRTPEYQQWVRSTFWPLICKWFTSNTAEKKRLWQAINSASATPVWKTFHKALTAAILADTRAIVGYVQAERVRIDNELRASGMTSWTNAFWAFKVGIPLCEEKIYRESRRASSSWVPPPSGLRLRDFNEPPLPSSSLVEASPTQQWGLLWFEAVTKLNAELIRLCLSESFERVADFVAYMSMPSNNLRNEAGEQEVTEVELARAIDAQNEKATKLSNQYRRLRGATAPAA